MKRSLFRIGFVEKSGKLLRRESSGDAGIRALQHHDPRIHQTTVRTNGAAKGLPIHARHLHVYYSDPEGIMLFQCLVDRRERRRAAIGFERTHLPGVIRAARIPRLVALSSTTSARTPSRWTERKSSLLVSLTCLPSGTVNQNCEPFPSVLTKPTSPPSTPPVVLRWPVLIRYRRSGWSWMSLLVGTGEKADQFYLPEYQCLCLARKIATGNRIPSPPFPRKLRSQPLHGR